MLIQRVGVKQRGCAAGVLVEVAARQGLHCCHCCCSGAAIHTWCCTTAPSYQQPQPYCMQA